MASNHPWYYDRRVNGCFLPRKKFACRSKETHDGIVIKKSIPRQNDFDDVIVINSGDSSSCFILENKRKYGTCADVEKQEILSSGDSSCFILESKRKYGMCADVEKQQILPKKRVKLEASVPSNVLAKKVGFEVAIVGYGGENEFELLGEISSGSYGMVYKARDTETGEIVAMKEELDGFCKSSLREIDILKSVIRHPSFVEFKQVVVDEYGCVYVVMEYIENDLRRAMKSMKFPFQVSEVRTLMKHLLEGVNFLHENGIMHRDLKPSNILLNDKGELKICDFGLSRHFERTFDSYSPRVATLWYKAPELLLGAEKYSCAIDMWAVGCIMAELLLEEVLFKGNSEIGQLQKICEILGTPNDIIWPGFSSLPGSRLKFVEQPLNLLSRDFSMLSKLGIDLLSKLLVYDPEERITAKDALNHDWFREL